MAARSGFSSRLGFILAAAGSAVGLGNVWGFPTKVAENGGAAFVLVYLLLAFCLAYPVLMAEFTIGRAHKTNIVNALGSIKKSKASSIVGLLGCLTAALILSFYCIVAGWMLSHLIASLLQLFAVDTSWLTEFSSARNFLFYIVFLLLTAWVVNGGVKQGIERWSVRLMPTLLLLIVALIVYVATLEGAGEGWSAYLYPDFSKILNAGLVLDAMGQAFFSMSLGVGTMLVYASYLKGDEHLPRTAAAVALLDIFVAFLAGMLIIPALYVASSNGVAIFNDAGALIQGPDLIFSALPSLFDSMGSIGPFISIIFFMLMMIAALTSSISMLEVPVSYFVDNQIMQRQPATWVTTAAISLASLAIVLNFEPLFSVVISISTVFGQPILGFIMCIFTGWLWHRDKVLNELKKGCPDLGQGIFWRVWPFYVKFVCPLVILLLLSQTLFS